jgi:hypothetical protein
VPPSKPAKKNEKPSGRRRNYEPKIVETGLQTFIPRGWANWVGVAMFGAVTLAVLFEVVASLTEGAQGGDSVAAAVTAGLLAWMTVLFARNRLKE